MRIKLKTCRRWTLLFERVTFRTTFDGGVFQLGPWRLIWGPR